MTTIRPMTAADYDQAAALWQAAEGIGLDDVDSREHIAAYLARNGPMSFAAIDDADGRIVGAVLCGTDGRRGYMHHLAVAPTHAGQGLGRSLCQACLDALGRAGIRKCHIFVFARNVKARNFYAATGWELREDLMVMSKET